MCALKTFNLDAEIYEEFSKHCKKHGISMSKKVENFIKQEMDNIKGIKGSDIGEFKLQIERDTKGKPQPPEPPSSVKDNHSMGRYC